MIPATGANASNRRMSDCNPRIYLMKQPHVAALALLLALPIIAHAQMQVPPADELGSIAWSSMAARSGEQALPTLHRSSTERTIHAPAPGGTLSIIFDAHAGDAVWTLRSYSWHRDASLNEEMAATEPESTTSDSGEPENPDPYPPTHQATPGDKITSLFQLGQWRYTVKYSYGVRGGVLGWHVDSIDAIYSPTPPPGPIYNQEK